MLTTVTADTTGDKEADAKLACTQRTVGFRWRFTMPCLDAVDNMDKAKALLDATTVKSNTNGTVVEVNKDVSKIDYGDQPKLWSGYCEQRKFTS